MNELVLIADKLKSCSLDTPITAGMLILIIQEVIDEQAQAEVDFLNSIDIPH
jgi:hypothetical protein